MDLSPKLPGSEIGKMLLAPTPRQAMVGATPRDGRKLSQSCAGGLRAWNVRESSRNRHMSIDHFVEPTVEVTIVVSAEGLPSGAQIEPPKFAET